MKHLTESLYAIVVPEEATEITGNHINDNHFSLWAKVKNYHENFFTDNGHANYEVLGTVSQDTITFDVEPYVESIIAEEKLKIYKEYYIKLFTVLTKEESFRSLLTSKGIYFEKPQYCGCSGPCGIPCIYADYIEKGILIEQNIKLVIVKKI